MRERPADRLLVPVGDEAHRWATRGRCACVLLVVHNVTSATRLLDVVPLFRDDLRVQLLATCTGSSPFQSGVAELLAEVGVPVLPWSQVPSVPVALAVSASLGGELHAIAGKLAVLSHGVGYNKTLAAPDTGHRTPDTGPPVFGLAPEWLLHDGRPVAEAMVLSHPEQLDRLRAACPPAAPTAVLGGDPCFDRILAARQHRDRYRRALGMRPGQRLVLLNSTWNPNSLFGDGGGEDLLPDLLPRLTEQLAVDEYRLAAVLHPNIWHGHGSGQVRLWLDRARRSGLTLVDPLHDWRQALIAADVVVGDFGSVTYYAAALGTPVLLGAAPLSALGADSPVAAFVRRAPRLDPLAPPGPQLDRVLAGHRPLPEPAELTSSAPGKAAELLRALFYRLIGLPEPERAALLDPLRLPPLRTADVTAPLRVLTEVHGDEVRVRRFADPREQPDGPGAAHLAVAEDALDPGVLSLADLIYRHGPPHDPRLGTPVQWAGEVLARYPGCTLAAYLADTGRCTARHRDGTVYRWSAAGPSGTPGPAGTDPAAQASALLARLGTGQPLGPDGRLTVRTGPTDSTSTTGPTSTTDRTGTARLRITQVSPGPAR
ncbi:hypothetical protein [Streptomyces tateyamensis]|uniref:hypothetical protein n=1 Tax=Streptomyces tateyamensis TaxID=565073 RepID=UPI0015E8D329|nr:hypothetical protein [Streptomyces tateyamensis]